MTKDFFWIKLIYEKGDFYNMRMEEELFYILIHYACDAECINSIKSLSTTSIIKGEKNPYSRMKREFLKIKERYPILKENYKLDLYEETTKRINTFEDQELFYELLDTVACPFLIFFLTKMEGELKAGSWPERKVYIKKCAMI